MDGPLWIVNTALSIALIGVSLYLLYRSLSIQRRPDATAADTVRWPASGRLIFDTSLRWLFFSSFIGLAAVGAHLLAEYTFHIYDVTPIDRFTHGLSGMAVTAVILNLSLTRNRKVY